MPTFANFKSAGREDPVGRAALAEQRRQFNKGRRDKYLMEGVDAYGKWAGDRTPIRDTGSKMAGALRDFTTAPMDASSPYADTAMIAPAASLPAVSSVGAGIEAAAPVVSSVGAGLESAIPLDAAADSVADTAVEGATKGLPLVSALRGGAQLIDGDIEGMLGTGAKAALATMGPAGIAASLGLGLMGV